MSFVVTEKGMVNAKREKEAATLMWTVKEIFDVENQAPVEQVFQLIFNAVFLQSVMGL